MLNDGIPLPTIPFFDLGKSGMTFLDRYIRLDFNPVPHKKMVQHFVAMAFRKFKETFLPRNKAKVTQKEKPLTLPQWLKIDY